MQCQHCGRIANPNDGDWFIACRCMHYIPEKDIRKALEPVADWFDMNGEEGPKFPLVEVVAEVAKSLVEDRNECLKLRSLLLELVNENLPEWMLDKIRESLKQQQEVADPQQSTETYCRMRLKENKQVFAANAVFFLKKGAIVEVKQFDEVNKKVLLDFGNGWVDWFHRQILRDYFEKVTA